MAENVESLSDIDRLSGQSLSTLNEALKDLFLAEGGFQSMDDISAKIFPSVFSAIQSCLLNPLRRHPRYADIEFVLSGSTSEGVNIPNMSRKADGRVDWEFEMDILCVFRDIPVGTTKDSYKDVIMVAQEGTPEGYFLLYVNSSEYRQKWGHFCTTPTNTKRKGEMYLNPLLIVEDMYQQIEHIFGQIPLLKDQFTLELNPPAVTLRLGGFDNVSVCCDIVVAVELPISRLPKTFPRLIREQPNWLADDTMHRLQNENLHLVGKCSPKGQARVEWRLSFNRLELGLLREIQTKIPVAITCYRIFKSIRYWHLNHPNFLHSYHLKMLFFRACHKYPVSSWTEHEIASSILSLLDDLFHCLATQSLPSFFLPECNLIQGVHSDFILTLTQKLSEIRKDPRAHFIDLKG